MKDIICIFIAFSAIVSLFGLSAFLFYKQVPGAGWFLFVVLLVAGGLRMKVD